ncbi:MAG: hypothetical protein JKY17_06390 [Magnetovibrio sp.]|nr:hypothetical protein [Magnetovibrio sp.]
MKRSNHETELRTRLEHLYYMGYTVIEEWEVKEWWQRERITKTVYAEILKIWCDVAGDRSKISANLTGHRYVFITPDKFTPLQEWSGGT